MMDQTVHSEPRSYDPAATGDLRSLLAMLDQPADTAALDDGLHRLAASMATLRRSAKQRR